jgi:O-antigen/teichoic acid export membrane protein
MSKKAELLKNTAILAFGKLSMQIVVLILLPVYTIYLSPAEFGFYDLILTYITLLAPALTIQLEMSVFRHLIDVREDRSGKISIISNVVNILGIAVVAISLMAFVLSQLVAIPYLLYITILLIVVAISGVLIQISRGLGNYKAFAVGSIISAIVTLLAAIYFVVFAGMGILGILISSILANIGASVYLVIANKVWRFINTKQLSVVTKKSILVYSLPLVPNNAAVWVVSAADRTLVTLMIDVAANGIYAVASRFPLALIGLFNVYNMSWTEAVSLHLNSKDNDRDVFLSDAFNTGIRLIASMGLLMVVLMHFVFPILIDSDFNEAYLYIPILTVGTVASAAVSMFGAVYIAKKMTKKVATTSIYAAALNIALTVLLIPIFGLFGAACASVISFSAIAVIRHFDLKKYITLSYDVRSFMILLVSYIIICILYYATNIIYDILAVFIATAVIFWINKVEIHGIIKRLRHVR